MNKIFEHLLFCSMIIFACSALLTCEIEDSEKIDCAIDIASYTSKLEEICCQRGCCYKEPASAAINAARCQKEHQAYSQRHHGVQHFVLRSHQRNHYQRGRYQHGGQHYEKPTKSIAVSDVYYKADQNRNRK